MTPRLILFIHEIRVLSLQGLTSLYKTKPCRYPRRPTIWKRVKPHIPNILSVVRALVPIPIITVWPEQLLVAIGLVAFGGFLDWLDGYMARKWGITSVLGSFFDTVGDKIFYLTILWLLWEKMPIWIFPVAVLIENALFAIRVLSYIGVLTAEIPANIFGKVKFLIQCGVLVGMLSGMFFDSRLILQYSIELSMFAILLASGSLFMHLVGVEMDSPTRPKTKSV